MFTKSIDSKRKYTDQNNNEVLDISESFMDTHNAEVNFYSVYKVPKNMEMRPDKVSISAYGSDEYTEMVCAYNNIRNPFTIEENDIVYMISLNNIYDNTYTPDAETGERASRYNIIKKYIDKTKLPATPGSQKTNASISKNQRYVQKSSVLPPNMAGINVPAYEIKDGRLYFGANNDNYGSSAVGTTSRTVTGMLNTNTSSNSDGITNKAIKSDSKLNSDGTISSVGNASDTRGGIMNRQAPSEIVNNILSSVKPSGNNDTDLSLSNNMKDGENELNNVLSQNSGYAASKIENPTQVYSAEDIQNIIDGIYSSGNMSALSNNEGLQSNNSSIADALNRAANAATIGKVGVSGGTETGSTPSFDNMLLNTGNAVNPNTGHALFNMNAADRESVVSYSDNDNVTAEGLDKNDIILKNERAYFDKNTDIGCASDGMASGDVITSAIKNKIK